MECHGQDAGPQGVPEGGRRRVLLLSPGGGGGFPAGSPPPQGLRRVSPGRQEGRTVGSNLTESRDVVPKFVF